MNFWQVAVRRVEKKYRVVYKHGPSTIAMFFAGIALSAWVVLLLLSGYPAVQYVYYTLRPATSAQLSKVLKELKTDPQQVVKAEERVDVPDNGLPPVDTTLPEGHYLSIPSLGIDTVIWEGSWDDSEKALKRGVWRHPEMAEPESGSPIVLAAHRFGYIEWDQEYRVKNSFFNLPKVNPGDEFEILWNQRHYKYRIERVTEGTEIDSYDYDAILYTCKFLVSPIRIIVYAKRVL